MRLCMKLSIFDVFKHEIDLKKEKYFMHKPIFTVIYHPKKWIFWGISHKIEWGQGSTIKHLLHANLPTTKYVYAVDSILGTDLYFNNKNEDIIFKLRNDKLTQKNF